ncbi:MAG: helix-turn-helix transcriptional regulator [Rhodococcus sp. (in: high G+C Gram-positive bacteria)]
MAEEFVDHLVVCHLGEILDARDMTLAELSRLAGVSVVNLSVLKNDRAKAIRFSTLTAVCRVLGCTPGDLFTLRPI